MKDYGPHKVLKGISISCAKGEICAVLGANGAGKSTLFKIISGLITPSSGAIYISSDSKKVIGGIIEKPSLYPYLTGRENLKLFGSIQGLKLSELELDEKLQEVGLMENNPVRVSKYSMGMKQRLGIAIALLNDPQALVWDEPFSGLDPMGTEALKRLILKLAKSKGLAIVISSHIMGPLLSLCDTLYVLREGELILSGAMDTIIKNYISHYEIRGEGFEESKVLKNYNALIEGNKVTVEISAEAFNELLQSLLEEKVVISAFNPIINFEKLL